MTLSFTGTREGITSHQYESVKRLILQHHPTMVVHGDCIGADTDFHKLINEWYRTLEPKVVIKIWPSNSKTRANNEGWDIIMPAQYALDRNKNIVNDGDRLIACPKNMQEELRSGTWATVRYAKWKARKIVYIVYPNGDVK